MDSAPGNPDENQLPPGLSAAVVEAAVATSGYPLQTIVAGQLRDRRFHITEEWAFRDDKSGQLRTLDILAALPLYDREQSQRYVRPRLGLLIECKQSTMPYVFFASETRPGLGGFGMSVVGLREDEISVTTDDDISTWSFSTIQALDLHEQAFVADPPCVSLLFSKAARHNKDVVLSGADPYQSLMLPLTKALHHYAKAEVPAPTAAYFDATLAVAVAVIDGPMVVTTVGTGSVNYTLRPWVRVYRHDVDDHARHKFERSRLHAVDCVHASWLSEYLSSHLEPFAAEYGKRALAHHKELATGRAFAPGLGRDSFRGVENRLRPRAIRHRAQRSSGILVNLRELIRGGLREVRKRLRHD